MYKRQRLSGETEDRRNVAKVRVSALAKELGTDSKTLLAHLNAMGEYVKSASSTIEAPVVRKVCLLYTSRCV